MSKVLTLMVAVLFIIAGAALAQAPSPSPLPQDPVARFAITEKLTPIQETALRNLITEEKQKKIANDSDLHAVLQDARKRARRSSIGTR